MAEYRDDLDRLIEGALSASLTERAPVEFVQRLERRLVYVRLLQRQRRVWITAAALMSFGVTSLFGVAGLFWYAVDVPDLLFRHVPGALGRIDYAVATATRTGVPWVIVGFAVATAGLVGAATLVRRRRKRVRPL